MEFYGYYFSSSSSSTSCLERFKQLTVKQVVGNLVSVIPSLVFAVVGTVLGTITGAILGQESAHGFFRGAVIGAISGVLLSIEVFESFRRLWLSDEKRIQCLLYLVDVIGSLVSGRLIRERVGPMMFTTVNSQLSITTPEPSFDNFETGGGCKGLSGDIIQKIPEIRITTNNHVNSEGERISCSVCLQDFQVAEQVRKLPYCHHMFHTICIDQWLVIHGSCPLCRRDL